MNSTADAGARVLAPRQRVLSARHAGYLALALLVVAGGGGLWLQMRRSDVQPFVIASIVPADCEQIAWLDRLDRVVDLAAGLSPRMPGSEGLVEALSVLAGVDLADPDAVADAGLQLTTGAVVFAWQDAAWAAVGLRDADGADHIVGLLGRRGHDVQARPAPEGAATAWHVRTRADQPVEADLWWAPPVLLARVGGMGSDGAAPAAEEPAQRAAGGSSAWAAWKAAKRIDASVLQSTTGDLHLRWTLAEHSAVRVALHDALGPLALLFGGVVDRIERIDADLSLDAAGPALDVRLQAAPGGLEDIARYHAGFLPGSSPALLDLGATLPDENALLVRLRLNPKLVDLLPDAVRDAVMPASMLARLDPRLAALDARDLVIDAVDGQIAAGLIGLADEAPLDPRTWAARDLRRLLSGWVGLQARDDRAARTLLERVRGLLADAGASHERSLGPWAGPCTEAGTTPWCLLADGRRLLWLNGKDTFERLQWVASGRFPSLAKAARTPLERELAAGQRWWAGALITTPRVVRSLRRRGVPDHFVAMLGGVTAAAVGVEWTDDAVHLRVEVRPADVAGEGL